MVAAHYRSHVEFSFEALDEAAAAFQRIEHFLDRAGDLRRRAGRATLPEAFAEAMDDDLGTPAAVAVIYDAVREGNKLLGAGDDRAARDRQRRRCARMLDVLGLDPFDPAWATGGGADERLAQAVDVLVAGLLEQRAGGPGGQGLRHRRRDPRPDQGGRHRGRGHARPGPERWLDSSDVTGGD